MEERRLFRVVAVSIGVLVGVGLLEALGALGTTILDTRRPQLPADLQGTMLFPGETPKMTPDPYLLYRIRPGEERAHYRSNALGLRGRETSLVASPDTFRVLFLGGSVAWGYTSLDDDVTLPARLEAYLGARTDAHPVLKGRHVEVLNGGVPSYVAWQEALAYSVRLRSLLPDAVVLLDGVNDVFSAILEGEAGLPERFDPERKAYGKVRLTPWLRDRWTRLRFREFTRALWPRKLAEYSPPPVVDVAAAYRRALEHVGDIARADGSLVLPVLQPSAILPDSKPFTEFERAVVAYDDRELPGQHAYFIESYSAMREMLGDLSTARSDLASFDATGAFANETADCFADTYHLTPHGEEILAQAIGNALLRKLDAGRP